MTATIVIPEPATARRITVPVFAALIMMIGPGLFDSYSIMGLPGMLGRQFAKILEGTAIGLVLLWMLLHRWVPRFNLPAALATLFLVHAFYTGLFTEDEEGFRYAAAKTIRVAASMFVILCSIRSRRDLDIVLLGVKGVSVGAALLVIIEVFVPGWRLDEMFGWGRGGRVKPMMQYEEALGSFVRARGPMSHPNWLGYYYGSTLMLPLYLWVRYPSRNARLLLAGATFLELTALVFGYVRLGVVGVGVGTMWIIVRGGVRYRAATLGGLAVAFLIIWPFLPEAWIGRVTDPDVWKDDKSLEMRLSQQFANIDVAMDHGGVGVGFGAYGSVFFAEASGYANDYFHQIQEWYGDRFRLASLGSHNCYLEILIEQGMIGLGLFLGFWLAAYFGLLGSYSRNRDDPSACQLARCLEGMIVSVAVMNGLIHTQERRIQWVVMGLLCAYLSLTRAGLMRLDGGGPAPPTPRERVGAPLRLALLALALAGSAFLLGNA